MKYSSALLSLPLSLPLPPLAPIPSTPQHEVRQECEQRNAANRAVQVSITLPPAVEVGGA